VKGKAPVLILVLVALLVVLGLAACGGSSSSSSPSPSPSASAASQTIKVDSALVPAVVDLKVGDQLKVRLNSNSGSTGYVWSAEGMDQEAVLKQMGKPVDIPATSQLVGAPGKTEFSFQAAEMGTEQLGFWYARPSDKGNPGASYALIVKVGKGHVPQTLKAGEDYTAETAQIRTGDTLVVAITHASDQGKASWQVASSTAPVQLTGSSRFSSANDGTVTMRFKGTGTGTGTLVLVNRPQGDPPLQTYALPVYVKSTQQPITVQVNHHDPNETFPVKVGDTVQLSLPAQPSTGYKWVIKKPDPAQLKQVGKPKFSPNNDTMGAKGKMLWTFSSVGVGKVTVMAALEGPQAGSTGPAKQFQFAVVAKPGFKPKTITAVDAYPAPTVNLVPGDSVAVQLAAKAGTWVSQSKSAQLVAGKPAVSGDKAIVTYKAMNTGIATPVLLAEASGGWPNQAYAFSAIVGKGTAPKTVNAAERRVTKSVQLAVGETFSVELPGNPDSGYAWTVSPLAVSGVIEPVGAVAFAPATDAMGSPGVFTAQFKAVAAGSVPLVMLYSGPTQTATPDGIWMTMVTVQ
jgi:predicted secreted protein